MGEGGAAGVVEKAHLSPRYPDLGYYLDVRHGDRVVPVRATDTCLVSGASPPRTLVRITDDRPPRAISLAVDGDYVLVAAGAEILLAARSGGPWVRLRPPGRDPFGKLVARDGTVFFGGGASYLRTIVDYPRYLRGVAPGEEVFVEAPRLSSQISGIGLDALAVDERYVYVSDDGHLYRVPRGGGERADELGYVGRSADDLAIAGRHLYFVGEDGVERLDEAGGPATVVFPPRGKSTRVLTDGERVFVVLDEVLYRLDPKKRAVTREGPQGRTYAADGGWLVWGVRVDVRAALRRPGVRARPIDGGASRLLVPYHGATNGTIAALGVDNRGAVWVAVTPGNYVGYPPSALLVVARDF
jgi:hypothetical protein